MQHSSRKKRQTECPCRTTPCGMLVCVTSPRKFRTTACALRPGTLGLEHPHNCCVQGGVCWWRGPIFTSKPILRQPLPILCKYSKRHCALEAAGWKGRSRNLCLIHRWCCTAYRQACCRPRSYDLCTAPPTCDPALPPSLHNIGSGLWSAVQRAILAGSSRSTLLRSAASTFIQASPQRSACIHG